MSSITYRPDVAAFLLSRLAEEFRKPRISKLFGGIGAQYQALEDAAWQLYTLRSVDTAEGWVLDVLGKLVGERRQGSLDADYRIRVRARIRANLSDGTIEDVLAVFRLLLGGAGTLRLQEYFPAGFVLRVSGVALTVAQIAIFARFLRQVRGAAIDAQLGYQTVADADAFVCATSSPLTSPVAVNAITITVADATSFPASGSVMIDEGLPSAETLVYTSRTSTQLLTAPATIAHSTGAMVGVVGSAGKGWGDTSNPSAGGALVGVI